MNSIQIMARGCIVTYRDKLNLENEGNLIYLTEFDVTRVRKKGSRRSAKRAVEVKLERMGTINREKILEKGRWTYKLILKKTPISTQSIENAPCLICPVEQKCSLDGEISPRNCQLIEDWVIAETKKPKKAK